MLGLETNEVYSKALAFVITIGKWDLLTLNIFASDLTEIPFYNISLTASSMLCTSTRDLFLGWHF